MKCCKCGAGIESRRGFTAIEPKGKKNRKWICWLCLSNMPVEKARKLVKRANRVTLSTWIKVNLEKLNILN